MKIEIRSKRPLAGKPQITVREKSLYSCKQCGNRYYSYHFFCPQCLGIVQTGTQHTSLLQMVSCKPDDLPEAQALIQRLSGVTDFDLETPFKSLPWICMAQSDPAILKVWRKALETVRLHCEVLATPPATKNKKRKAPPPLFPTGAPYPQFLPAELSAEIRSLAGALPSAPVKLKWAETASLGLHLLERIYTEPSEHVLFVDFLFKIQEYFREFTSRFLSSKWTEETFVKRHQRLEDLLRQMESDMNAVRDQVQDQL